MTGKITSVILIIMVNILLLAHAVVPHHHHNGLPHFVADGFPLHGETDEGEDSCCHHSKEEGTCLFEQSVDVINWIKKDDTCIAGVSHDYSNLLLQAVLFSFSCDISLLQEDLPLREPPYLINYHSVTVNSGRSLRAPPVA
jgi:hypothetical protein